MAGKSSRFIRLALALLVPLLLVAAGPGFRTRRLLEQHYLKHGGEFGHISRAEYLRMAQSLRDTPVGGSILEALKPGIITKFDRRTGAFGAYNRDGTIRTFFIPVGGEHYFQRQARRP